MTKSIFWSYSFGHAELVKWLFLHCCLVRYLPKCQFYIFILICAFIWLLYIVIEFKVKFNEPVIFLFGFFVNKKFVIFLSKILYFRRTHKLSDIHPTIDLVDWQQAQCAWVKKYWLEFLLILKKYKTLWDYIKQH